MIDYYSPCLTYRGSVDVKEQDIARITELNKDKKIPPLYLSDELHEYL